MENKKLIKQLLLWIVIGVLSSLVAHFIIELLYNFNSLEDVINLIFEVRTELFILGSGVLFIFYLMFSSIFGSSIMGSLILIFISLILGIVTRYKYLFRMEPLFPNELYMIREIPFLLEMIGITKSTFIISLFLLIIIFLIYIYKFIIKPRKKRMNLKFEYVLRFLGVAVSIGLIIQIMNFNHPENKVKDKFTVHATWVNYNQDMNYEINGFVAGFLSNLPAPSMEQSLEYSHESIEKITDKYKRYSEELNKDRENRDLDTNIIFVMNETFSDPFNLSGIESNKDPLVNFRVIKEESVDGNVMSQHVGGGTATSEFQALTSFSMEPFAPHITSPYIQLVSQMNDYPSITKKFKDYDYYTTAIHPYSASWYRRTDVYEYLEFDEFIHEETIKYREKISEKHPYISDFAAYQEVFDVMKSTENSDFIHLVTMQNHGSYAVKYDNVNYEVGGTDNAAEANPYFKDLENSDISLRLLINKINDFSEPILLVFWGDHLPWIYGDNIIDNNSYQTMREAPFLVYSNRHELNEEVEVISPIYLSNFISDILDIKVSPYEAMLKVLYKNIPVLENGLYLENGEKQTVSTREELSEDNRNLLEEYTLIMYDVTNGQKYTQGLEFFNH